MKVFFSEICGKTKNHKSKNRHYKTKRHYCMKNSVTNTYNYNDIVQDDVEKIVQENIISQNNNINEFKSFVSCKINDDKEIGVYKDEHDLCVVLHTFLGVETLYIHVAGKIIGNTIRENVSSRYDYNCTPHMKTKNLTLNCVSRYDDMTYRYQLQQPRPMIESKKIKHIKYMSHEEQFNNYNLLTYKHKLNVF